MSEFSTRSTRGPNLDFKNSGKHPAPPQTGSFTKPTLNLSPDEAPRAPGSLEPKSSPLSNLLVVALICSVATGLTGQTPKPTPPTATTVHPSTSPRLDETAPTPRAFQVPPIKRGPPVKPPDATATPTPAVSFPLVAPPDEAKAATLTKHKSQIWRVPAPPCPDHPQATVPADLAPNLSPPSVTTETSETAKPPFEAAPSFGTPAPATVSGSTYPAVRPLPTASESQEADKFLSVALSPTTTIPTTVEHYAISPRTHRPLLSYNGEKWNTNTAKGTQGMGRQALQCLRKLSRKT